MLSWFKQKNKMWRKMVCGGIAIITLVTSVTFIAFGNLIS